MIHPATWLGAVFFCALVLGTHLERATWERKTMGDLCAEGKAWACHLHPSCEMQALVCFKPPPPAQRREAPRRKKTQHAELN